MPVTIRPEGSISNASLLVMANMLPDDNCLAETSLANAETLHKKLATFQATASLWPTDESKCIVYF